MKFFEKMVRAYLNNEPIPIKGHTKITLTDVNTGEVKVYEDDNLVTNAVAEILAKNWCGLARFSGLMPLYKLFGGVMCFEDQLTESADNYKVPADSVNRMTAHAGDEPNTSAQINSPRGNPNTGETTLTDTSIKFVWDFSTNQGNGKINCVCLVPYTLGNMGTRPYTADYCLLSAFGDNQTENNTWSEELSKHYPFTIASDGKSCKSLYVSGTTFKEYTMRHDFYAFGIMRTPDTWQLMATRTATLGTAFGSKSCIFDDDTYYYVATVTSTTKMSIDKIAKSDMAVTSSELTFSGVSLYNSDLGSAAKNMTMRVWAYDGTYLYYPNSDGNKFLKLNIANPADVDELPETVVIHKGEIGSGYAGGTEWATPIVLGAGFVIGSNYMINSGHVYQTKDVIGVGSTTSGTSLRTRFVDAIKVSSATFGNAFYSAYANQAGQCAILCQAFLSTINNLENEVNKSSSQVMKIEYTLTEA